MAADMTNRANDLADALTRIAQWADAYPASAFPPPDADYLRRATEVLAANGMSIDRISAHEMRRVVEGVGGIAREALNARGTRFALGDPVRKTKGSSWHGRVVGFYSTALTPIGYAVESSHESGSVQIYPEAALEIDPDAHPG